ncbi:MAG: hypothetical protein ACJAXZ_004014 [Akkermansiaceae bacterium]|jgi:hypothetical protein
MAASAFLHSGELSREGAPDHDGSTNLAEWKEAEVETTQTGDWFRWSLPKDSGTRFTRVVVKLVPE